MSRVTNPQTVMAYNSAVMGMQNYYQVATNVNLDFTRLAFHLTKTLHNRLENCKSEKGAISLTYKKFYGEYKGKITFVCGIALYPIYGVKTVPPMCFSQQICNYTEVGRAYIHDNLKMIDMKILRYIMKHPLQDETTELNDNRISLYVGQNRNELQYYTKLKNRHADNIAQKLNEYGVRFSGLRKGYTTTITINRADIPRYEAAVAEVKQMYQQNSRANNQKYGNQQNYGNRQNYQPAFSAPVFADRGSFGNARPFTGDFDNLNQQGSLPNNLYNVLSDLPQRSNAIVDYKNVPIIVESYMDAKMNGHLSELNSSIKASQACRDYIEQHIHDEYENRNFKGFVQNLVDKFGIDRTMYTVAATIQLKMNDGRFTNEVKDMARQYVFDSDKTRLKFLTETHPVMLNGLYESLIDKRFHLQREQAVVEEKTRLPDFFKDKYLNSIEKVSISDDFRGIPETKYYHSSADEYFVEGIRYKSKSNAVC